MDLNLKRRKRELAIAEQVAVAFLATTDASALAPPEHLTRQFTLVCARLSVTPNDAAIGRILAYTLRDIVRRKRALDDLAAALNRLPSLEPH
jgi:hypothetical protein